MEETEIKKDTIGGNELSCFKDICQSKLLFTDKLYTYYLLQHSSKTENFSFESLSSFTIYILETDESVIVRTPEEEYQLKHGDHFQVENQKDIKLSIPQPNSKVLVAGTSQTKIKETSVKLSKQNQTKKVIKPWGYELWINGNHPNYAFKYLHIKQGTKTSLQYHQVKHETQVLFSGKARFHYKSNPTKDNDNVRSEDVSWKDLSPISSVDISKNCLHRIEALTDVSLYEVSTPQLDDVIRVSDDTNRKHGIIASEHIQKTLN